MHKHSHGCSTCKHDCLHYCDCCQKVYCCKCKQEWGYYQPYVSPRYWPATVLYYDTTIVTDDTTCSTLTCEVHTH